MMTESRRDMNTGEVQYRFLQKVIERGGDGYSFTWREMSREIGLAPQDDALLLDSLEDLWRSDCIRVAPSWLGGQRNVSSKPLKNDPSYDRTEIFMRGDVRVFHTSDGRKTMEKLGELINPTKPAPDDKTEAGGAAPSAANSPQGSEDHQGDVGNNEQTAHILFMDVVGYSKLTNDLQTERVNTLQTEVSSAPQFIRAKQRGEIEISFAGDCYALCFFSGPFDPAECALHIARAMKKHPELQLRMGLHTGLVKRHQDVNKVPNFIGDGANIAQRVMNCADPGQILASDKIVALLGSSSGKWFSKFHGPFKADEKHGLKLELYNLVDGEVGTVAIPSKIRRKRLRNQSIVIGLILVIIAFALYLPREKPLGDSAGPEARTEKAIALLHQRGIEVSEYSFFKHIGDPGTELIDLFIDAGISPNVMDDTGKTALALAIEKRRPDTVKALLSKGAGINKPDSEGNTPLMWASKEGDLTLVQLFLQRGASVNERSVSGNSALLFSIGGGKTEILRALVAAGADVNANSGAAIIQASQEPALDDVEALVRSGANINVQDSEGLTPLMWAGMRGNEVMIRLLLRSGANRNIRDKNKKTASDWAKESGHPELAKLINSERSEESQSIVLPVRLGSVQPAQLLPDIQGGVYIVIPTVQIRNPNRTATTISVELQMQRETGVFDDFQPYGQRVVDIEKWLAENHMPNSTFFGREINVPPNSGIDGYMVFYVDKIGLQMMGSTVEGLRRRTLNCNFYIDQAGLNPQTISFVEALVGHK